MTAHDDSPIDPEQGHAAAANCAAVQGAAFRDLGTRPVQRRSGKTRERRQIDDEIARRLLTGEAGETLDRDVDTIEQGSLRKVRLTRNGGLAQPVAGQFRAREPHERRHALALVHAPSMAADLGVGPAK